MNRKQKYVIIYIWFEKRLWLILPQGIHTKYKQTTRPMKQKYIEHCSLFKKNLVSVSYPIYFVYLKYIYMSLNKLKHFISLKCRIHLKASSNFYSFQPSYKTLTNLRDMR